MSLAGRKFVVTGAGRGLGAALAVILADRGAHPVLLGRHIEQLASVADAVTRRNTCRPATIVCDLADLGSVAAAAAELRSAHLDIDGLINNGAAWTSGALEQLSDADLSLTINSALTGTMALTRHVLPLLRDRPSADIHNVVSMSGLPYARLRGASLAFRAGKAGQDGFNQGLVEELAGTAIRVTSTYPGIIKDLSPLDAVWDAPRGLDAELTNRDVVEAIIFALGQPPHVVLRSIVIERRKSDFLS